MYIGLDIVEIKRIEIMANKESVIERVFTYDEVNSVKTKLLHKRIQCLASMFAAKEAAVKALGIGFTSEICAQDIETLIDESGNIVMTLRAGAREKADELRVKRIQVALATEKKYAMATVILET